MMMMVVIRRIVLLQFSGRVTMMMMMIIHHFKKKIKPLFKAAANCRLLLFIRDLVEYILILIIIIV